MGSVSYEDEFPFVPFWDWGSEEEGPLFYFFCFVEDGEEGGVEGGVAGEEGGYIY